jgi:hypothetical protein
MIVPEYWAEARLQTRTDKRQVTVRRFGWSDVSQEEAQKSAETRTREAMDRLLAGEKLPRREFKVPYNGAEGVPIREEILARHGDTVITRNSYGARCLNTPDVAFLDVDFNESAERWLTFKVMVLVAFGASLAVWQAGASAGSVVVGAILGIFIAALIAGRVASVFRAVAGGPEAMSRRRIDRFLRLHRNWTVRIYRTPAGLRLLVMHRTFTPDDPEFAQAVKSLRVDRVYAQMCFRQKCFRARLDPKPWRIGLSQLSRPWRGAWPLTPERAPLRQKWLVSYDRAAAAYAACTFLTSVGSGTVDPKAESVMRLHDTLSRAHSGLEIA